MVCGVWVTFRKNIYIKENRDAGILESILAKSISLIVVLLGCPLDTIKMLLVKTSKFSTLTG